MKTSFRVLFIWSLAVLAMDTRATTQSLTIAPAQGGEVDLQVRDEVPLLQRLQIEQEIENNIIRLRSEGKLLADQAESMREPAVNFPVFPLRARPNYIGQYQGFFQLVNYVDLDPNAGQTLDYNCGARTYDGHRGIDYTLWPFPWWMMDQSVIEIIAAEYGQIIGKSNGEPDRSCPGNVQSNNWNAVYVQHLDGTVAWYGHMKNGSLTTKQVGEIVIAGEYLGLVGSSGFSTHPHLHFEYHATNNANDFVEPHAGSCRGGPSYWVVQRPYRDSRINMVLAHNAVPNFDAGCPNPFQETRHDALDFFPGETAIFAVYLSDEQQGQVKTMHLIKPNGVNYTPWTHTSPGTYSGSWWYWQIPLTEANLGEAPMLGTWRFQAQHENGTFDDVTFTVGGVFFRDGFE